MNLLVFKRWKSHLARLRPISANKLIKIIIGLGYEEIRQKGSHKIFKNLEGKIIVIPYHKGEKISKG